VGIDLAPGDAVDLLESGTNKAADAVIYGVHGEPYGCLLEDCPYVPVPLLAGLVRPFALGEIADELHCCLTVWKLNRRHYDLRGELRAFLA